MPLWYLSDDLINIPILNETEHAIAQLHEALDVRAVRLSVPWKQKANVLGIIFFRDPLHTQPAQLPLGGVEQIERNSLKAASDRQGDVTSYLGSFSLPIIYQVQRLRRCLDINSGGANDPVATTDHCQFTERC